MPITQDRLVALVLAGDDFEECSRQMHATITKECELVEKGYSSPREALENIKLFCQPQQICNDYGKSRGILFTERKLAASRWNTNLRKAAAQRLKRQTSPDKIRQQPTHGMERAGLVSLLESSTARNAVRSVENCFIREDPRLREVREIMEANSEPSRAQQIADEDRDSDQLGSLGGSDEDN